MWDRKEIKAQGKEAFKANWLNCAIVEFILGILLAAQASGVKENSQEIKQTYESSGLSPALIISALSIATIIALAIRIFIQNPLVVGGHRFFIENSYYSKTPVVEMVSTFKDSNASSNFFNIFITMFVRDLITGIGYAVFVIPGIYFTLRYKMVPFILAENPGMDWKAVLQKSAEMTKGQKWSIIVFDLSFIGWFILSAITANVVGIVYANPYYRASLTELYKKLK